MSNEFSCNIEIWIITGIYYGYPECCINSFLQNLIHRKSPGKLRIKAGNKTGFIPCLCHAKKINSRKITIQSIIKNRIAKNPFPSYLIKHKKKK